MNLILILPIIIPLLTALLCLLTVKHLIWQRLFGLLGSIGLLISNSLLFLQIHYHGIQSTQLGNWPAPFGITIVADLFSAIMVLITGILGFTVTIYSLISIDKKRESHGYYALLQFLFMGACGAFLTGDFFNLYIWFAVLLIASFVLMILGNERAELEGAIKYVTLTLISLTLFLAGVGILYGMVGSLNMADVALKFQKIYQPELMTILAILFLLAFGIKSAIFPLFFWLPASYHTLPVAITALFSALLTKVGVYSLIRIFTLIFIHDIDYTHQLILIISGLTMITGVLGAVAQTEIRRLFSFHIISQIGYLLMGLGIYTKLSLAGTIFFMAHVIFAQSALFLVSGLIYHLTGSYNLKKLGGLSRSYPSLAVFFLIPALSLAGIPPLSGFFAKLILVKAGLEIGHYFIVALSLIVNILTLFAMIKIWSTAFWKDKMTSPNKKASLLLPISKTYIYIIPIIILTLLNIVLGLLAEPFLNITYRAADQLLNHSEYINVVLRKY